MKKKKQAILRKHTKDGVLDINPLPRWAIRKQRGKIQFETPIQPRMRPPTINKGVYRA